MGECCVNLQMVMIETGIMGQQVAQDDVEGVRA